MFFVNNFEICFAKEDEFREIVDKLDLYFDKFPGYFENLVPVLYKKGKNTYGNHIVVKCDKKIVGMIAVKENVVYIGEEEYKFCVLGSLAVDFEYRTQGIMGLLFDFILNKYSDCDFLGLSGKFDRYKRFGFYPSEKSYCYSFSNRRTECKYTYEEVNGDNVGYCTYLHDKESFKVRRDDMIDNLYMWEYKPYIIKYLDKMVGYLVYNPKNNIVEEILLEDCYLINDIMEDFCCFNNLDINLKISMANRYLELYLESDLVVAEYIERTLYKINNPSLKGIYIPRSDLI